MKKKIIIISIIVLVLGGIGFKIYQAKQPLKVVTAQIEKSDYEEYHYEEGEVQSREQMKVLSNVSGKIVDLFVEEGDTVNKGDVILNIDKDDLEYELNILYAQRNSLVGQQKSEGQTVKSSQLKLQEEAIEIAKNKVDSLEIELKRKKELFESGAISKNDFEVLEDQYKKAVGELNIQNFKLTTLKESSKLGSGKSQYYTGQIEKIDLQIQRLQEQMEEMTVVAPINGTIANIPFDKGDHVLQNQLLFEVFHPDLYEIESYVLAKEVKNLDIGMTAYIEIENQSKIETIKGRITFIAPNAIELVSPLGLIEKKVKVLVEPQKEVNLIQGEKVDVQYITYQKGNAQVISKDYIFPWNDGEGIWVIDEGKAKILKINKSFDSSSAVILENVLDEQTKIIIPPYPEKIEEGVKVISK